MAKDLRERIHEANIAVHRFEAKYYELIHPEVFNKHEQKRINSTLRKVDKLIADNQKKALDFGAGTGNLTGKLLQMGYKVTATDISAEMCEILKKKYKDYLEAKKVIFVNSPIEDMSFDREEFDLIACYSVLHHLPDYVDAIQRLSVFLKKGGVMYLDHEISPYYWNSESHLARVVKLIYFHSNPLLNTLYFQIMGVDIPSLDYSLSDYWHRKEHPLDHRKIEYIFKKEKFDFFTRIDYHINRRTWVLNPIFCIYKYTCKPEMSYWVAKK